MTDQDSPDHEKNSENTSKNRNRKMMTIGAAVSAAFVLILAAAIPGLALNAGATNAATKPTGGYDIHVTVGRHDSMNLDAQMDHYCKLDNRIVAVCQLYARDSNAKPGTGPMLSQIEFIITEEQYKQLPAREKPSWHNHAVELTPERGSPGCVELPQGLECGALVELLKKTYGKVITIWDPADPVPSYPPYALLVDSPYALGQDLNDNLHKEWPTSCGEDSSAEGRACHDGEVKLKVKALGPSGEERRMFIRIGQDGKIISEGFAPFAFNGTEGKTYQVRATNFDGLVFDRWEDGSTNRHRMVTLSADMELMAHYKFAQDKKFTAKLSGGEEVPPTNSTATGAAELKLNSNATQLSYRVNVTSIDKVTAAHLHLAPKGVNGPVVATLYSAVPGGEVNGILAEGTIDASDLSGPLAGKTIGELVDEMGAGNVYVNVHSSDYPGGEIRGQAG